MLNSDTNRTAHASTTMLSTGRKRTRAASIAAMTGRGASSTRSNASGSRAVLFTIMAGPW